VLSVDGRWTKQQFDGAKPDVAVVVFGEDPYAEWHGDITNIEYQYASKTDIKLLKKLKGQGIPVVSVFITGRPLWTLQSGDDKVQNDFQGKLSFSWPKTVAQAVLNVGQDNYDPLFPYGYGLTYASPKEVADDLDESSVRRGSDKLEEAWMFVSREMSNYQFLLTEQGSDPVVVNGNREISAKDENLLRLSWKGLRPAKVALAAKNPLDLSQYVEQRSALSFSMKVDQAPKGKVTLSMECAGACQRSLELTDTLASADIGEYADYKIDLGCFVDAGVNLNKLEKAFVIHSTGALDLVISDIKVVPNIVPGACWLDSFPLSPPLSSSEGET